MTFDELIAPVAAVLGERMWVVHVFAVVLFTLLFNYLVRRLLDGLVARTARTRNFWDDAVIGAARGPIRLLVWIMGLSAAADIALPVAEQEIGAWIEPIRRLGFVVCLGVFGVRLVREMEHRLVDPERGARMDETTAQAVGKLTRASIIITAALAGLQTLGVSVSGVLAFGGIGGIAVGFAARDLLANFFGGLMIFLDRPFSVGDWVRSPDREIEGTVEEIGWRLTRIRTFDLRPLYVPNSAFTSLSVENPSRMLHRRIHETIGLRYEDLDRVQPILEDVRAMLHAHPEIMQERTLMVNFVSYGASSLDFFIYCFTRTRVWAEYHEIKEDVLLRIGEIIHRHGGDIAFPTRTLHLHREPEAVPEDDGSARPGEGVDASPPDARG